MELRPRGGGRARRQGHLNIATRGSQGSRRTAYGGRESARPGLRRDGEGAGELPVTVLRCFLSLCTKFREKFLTKILNLCLTYGECSVTIPERVCESTGVLCEEAGDCSGVRGNFRGVCPVSEVYPAHDRAAGTCSVHAYIAWTGSTGHSGRYVFRPRSDTHGCVCRIQFRPYA